MSALVYRRFDRAMAENIPKEMRERRVWVHWDEGPDDGSKKRAKVPFYQNGNPRGRTAPGNDEEHKCVLDSAADRQQLVTFDELMSAPRASAVGTGVALLPDDMSGIDLDGVISADGRVNRVVTDVLEHAPGAYCEISPSGTGVKIFGIGDIGTLATEALEIYTHGRFFTVTGERHSGDKLVDLCAAAAFARKALDLHAESKETKGKKGKRKQISSDETVQDGDRNNTLWFEATSRRARNVPRDQAWQQIVDINARCEPPITERDLKKLLERAYDYPPSFATTDLGNAQRLVHRIGDDLRYVPKFGRFFLFDGTHWRQDEDGEAERAVKDTVRAIYDEARDAKDEDVRRRLTHWAMTSQSAAKIAAAQTLAKTEPGVPLSQDTLDSDPMLLGVSNGTIDLCTGALRVAHRDDYITRICPIEYDPTAIAPTWDQFVLQIMGGDADMAEYLRRAVGYSLTGATSEQCLFLLHGSGANGKSTFLNILRLVLGPYAATTSEQTWMARDQRGPNNDIAALRGARLVVSSETEDGARFAEVTIKMVTGGEPISARFLHQEFFTFVPTFKLWIAANHKPLIKGDDHAIWRRIRLIPFAVTFTKEQQDRKLERKLRAELPGVLAWAVRGCIEWQRSGLSEPQRVEAATTEYRREQDHFGQFIEDRCEMVSGARVSARLMYFTYTEWAEDQGIEHPWAQQRFGRKLVERGVVRERTRDGIAYIGVKVRGASTPVAGGM